MKVIIVSILLFANLTSKGQTNYSKYVTADLINKKQTVQDAKGDKEEIIYLGEIKNKTNQTIFYILSTYSEVQATNLVHGHSNIIYLDCNKKLKKQYELGLPEELPFKLKNNCLYFYFTDSKTKKKSIYKNNVGIEMPKTICVEPNNCY